MISEARHSLTALSDRGALGCLASRVGRGIVRQSKINNDRIKIQTVMQRVGLDIRLVPEVDMTYKPDSEGLPLIFNLS